MSLVVWRFDGEELSFIICQSSKKVVFRADKKNQLQAVAEFKGCEANRTATPAIKGRTLQSVVGPGSKNKIVCKLSDHVPEFEDKVVVADVVQSSAKNDKKINKNPWVLGDKAHKDSCAFMSAIQIKQSGVIAEKVANAAKREARAVAKESWDVYGHVLADIKTSGFDPEVAKAFVDAFKLQL